MGRGKVRLLYRQAAPQFLTVGEIHGYFKTNSQINIGRFGPHDGILLVRVESQNIIWRKCHAVDSAVTGAFTRVYATNAGAVHYMDNRCPCPRPASAFCNYSAHAPIYHGQPEYFMKARLFLLKGRLRISEPVQGYSGLFLALTRCAHSISAPCNIRGVCR